MPGSTFGHIFRVTTFGESHGGGVGCVVDGVTPGVELSEGDIQEQLNRRRPGQSTVTTTRSEPDLVKILSGLYEGKTTGTPIMMYLQNHDAKPGQYEDIKDLFRPGHADFTYQKKYGIRDYHGGGRASGRETAGRVAAGAVARKLLTRRGVKVIAYTLRAAEITCKTIDFNVIEHNPMRAAERMAAVEMVRLVEEAMDRGDSVGGIIECRIQGVPPGLGEPVFDRLDADLAKAMLSIGGTKGIEFGAGFAAADMTGSRHNDEIGASGFLTNNAGGMLGGISNGAEIVFRVAVKPTSSISSEQRTVDIHGSETTIRTEGRHDPCLCPRMVPVIEAMAAIVIEDHFKLQAALLA